eukprot:g7078.t1 g7078   contig23:1807757-1809052(-)
MNNNTSIHLVNNKPKVRNICEYDIISIATLDLMSVDDDTNTSIYFPHIHVNNVVPSKVPTIISSHVEAPYDEVISCCSDPVPFVISPPTSRTASPSKSNANLISITDYYENVEEKYHVDPHILGVGHHGSVRQCVDRSTGQQFAIKSLRKSEHSSKLKDLDREVMLLDEMNHERIIRLVDLYEDEEYLHLVTNLCHGGELFDRIRKKSAENRVGGCFSEQQAAKILHQLLSSVSYMHKNNVVHRDLKPENILFETTDEDSSIKIIDFGLARKHYAKHGEPPMKSLVGTPYYLAPEVLRKCYGKECDLWSVGVIAYILLSGYPPFNAPSSKGVYQKVMRGKYWFPSAEWKHVSIGAKDFIHRLLQMDPKKRMTADQALIHPWILSQLNRKNVEFNREDSSVEVVFEESRKQDLVVCKGAVEQMTLPRSMCQV